MTGSAEVRRDRITASALARLAATLDHPAPPWPAGSVPPLGHWLAFLPDARQSAIGADGHPDRSDFAPAAGLPRRMWAGSRLTFHHPLAPDTEIERRTTVLRSDRKQGRSGALLFVTFNHRVRCGAIECLTEEQDVVFRAPSAPGVAAAAPPGQRAESPPLWTRVVEPSAALLFRYSALTFNAHRIHVDRDYARSVEGYADLVVHGPLLATLLIDLFLRHQPGATVTHFAFRADRPVLAPRPFRICGIPTATGAELWAEDADGNVCLRADLSAR